MLSLLIGDFSYLALGSVLVLLQARTLSKLVRFILGAGAIWLLGFYLLDFAVVTALNVRLSIQHVIRFIPELGIVWACAKWWQLALIPLIAAASLIRSRIDKNAAFTFAGGLLFLGIVVEAFGGAQLGLSSEYRVSTSEVITNFWKNRARVESYGPAELLKYDSRFARRNSVSMPDNRNIIVLLVESLSASESLLVSGLRDGIPEIDALAKRGTLFTNYVSNYPDTEGAISAMFSAMPPIPYSGSNTNIYESFLPGANAVRELRSRGFHAVFLTPGPLSFLLKGEAMRGLGFDAVIGRDETPRLQIAPRFTFQGASDEALYTEAIDSVKILRLANKKFFMTMLTLSLHFPYKDPSGIANTRTRLLRYTGEQLSSFVDRLHQLDYFRDGVLFIVGDHRRMSAMEPEEIVHYGDSAPSRVFALAMGADIPAGAVVDTPIDHAHFFSAFYPLTQGVSDAAPELIITVPNYSRYGNAIAPGPMIFDTRDLKVGYPARLDGPKLTWEGRIPQDTLRFEEEIHMFRAAAQLRAQKRMSCKMQFTDEATPLTGEKGLTMYAYDGIEIAGALPDASPRRFDTRRVTETEFPNLKQTLGRDDKFAVKLKGFLSVDRPGNYRLWVRSDDGVCLAIDRQVVLDDNIRHMAWGVKPAVPVWLDKGLHELELRYFQAGGSASLRFGLVDPVTDSSGPMPDGFLVPAQPAP